MKASQAMSQEERAALENERSLILQDIKSYAFVRLMVSAVVMAIFGSLLGFMISGSATEFGFGEAAIFVLSYHAVDIAFDLWKLHRIKRGLSGKAPSPLDT
jgi:hypothetical protein